MPNCGTRGGKELKMTVLDWQPLPSVMTMGSQLPMERRGLAEVFVLGLQLEARHRWSHLTPLQRAKFLSFWSLNSWPAGVPYDTPVPRDPEEAMSLCLASRYQTWVEVLELRHSRHSGWKSAAVLSSLITDFRQLLLDVKGEDSRMTNHTPLPEATEITA